MSIIGRPVDEFAVARAKRPPNNPMDPTRTAAACVLALISSLLRWHEPGAAYLLVGSALYLVGSLLVTIVFNVPKNEALASIAPADPNGASLWAAPNPFGLARLLRSARLRSDGRAS